MSIQQDDKQITPIRPSDESLLARMFWITIPRSCSSAAFRIHLVDFRMGAGEGFFVQGDGGTPSETYLTQVVVPENIDIKDKFSLTQVAWLRWC